MKRIFNALGLMLVSALTLTNCTKNIETPVVESEGVPFEIVASTVETKTVNDGMSTLWAAGDQINVFYAVGETADYVSAGAFTVNNVEEGIFTGTLPSELNVEEEYDWYAMYPYNASLATPENTTVAVSIGTGLVQDGYNSTAHLAGEGFPLYGKAVATPGAEMPSVEMKQLASVIAVNVTNNSGAPIEIEEVSFDADGESIAGTYYIDFSGDKVEYKSADSEAVVSVTVQNPTSLADGDTATIYLAVAPFVAPQGNSFFLTVNDMTKDIVIDEEVTFNAGKIKTFNFSYEAAGPKEVTVEEFIAKGVSTTEWYKLTGIISNIYNTQYGNFYLTDETGTVTVYGLKASESASKTSFSTLGLKEGDQVTLVGNRAEYQNNAQVGNAYYVSHIPACTEPVISCVDNIVTISAETGATIYYTINGDEPTESSTVYSAPIEIFEDVTVKAFAVAEGKVKSSVASRNCKFVDPNDEEDPIEIGTILWAEDWGTEGANSTSFTSNTVISSYTYSGRTGYGENATSVTYKSDASNNVRITKSTGTNCTSGHLWFNKSVAGELVTSSINLYGVTSLKFSHSQGTSSSLCQSYYSIDGGSTWTKLGETGPNAKKSYTFTVPSGTASIMIKLAHPSSNSKNTRVDNLVLEAN